MSQTAHLSVKGLHTFANDISDIPDGALVEADNVVIDRPGVVEPMRGFDAMRYGGGAVAAYSDLCTAMTFYQGYPVLSGVSNGVSTYRHFDGFTSIAAAFPQTNRMKFAQMNNNLYMNTYISTSSRIEKMDNLNSIVTAGMPPALGLQAVLASAALTTPAAAVPPQTAVSYRIVYGNTDRNNNLILGAPSNIAAFWNTLPAPDGNQYYIFIPSAASYWVTGETLTNSGHTYTIKYDGAYPNPIIASSGGGDPSASGTLTYAAGGGSGNLVYTAFVKAPILTNYVAPTLIIQPPGTMSGNFFMQIYRSNPVPSTVAATVNPPDEQYLIAQIPTGLVAGSSYLYTDNVVPGFGGAILYTASSQSGIQNAYVPLPSAVDIVPFANCMFYLGAAYRYSISFALTKVYADTHGINTGDTFTITDGTVTKVYTVGSGNWFFTPTNTNLSPAQALQNAAMGLVNAINLDTGSRWWAYYDSGLIDLPGFLRIETRLNGYPLFTIASSNGYCWDNPRIGSAVAASKDAFLNTVAYSVPQQPESVPALNTFYPGSGDKAVYRGFAVRDSLFLLKEDGIYRIYGSDPSTFQLTLLDQTCRLIAPDAACMLSNQIFALTTQGVVTISEAGVTIISRPIESDILAAVTINPNIATIAHAFSYESQRAFYLCLPTTATDTKPTQYFRYNLLTDSWTRGTLGIYAGAVDPLNDILLVAPTVTGNMLVEKKKLDYTDYSEYSETSTISAINSGVLTISTTYGISVGDVVYQNDNSWGIVTAVSGNDVTVASPEINLTNTTFSYSAVDTTNDYITAPASSWPYPDQCQVTITSSGTLPAPLAAATTYYVKYPLINTTPGFYYLYLSATHGGGGINLTTQGTGNHTLVPVNPTSFSLYGRCDILKPISTKVTWAPKYLGNPAQSKQIREAQLLFRLDIYGMATIGFASDIQPSLEYETIYGINDAPWGLFSFGDPVENQYGGLWGGGNRRRTARISVPRNQQRCQSLLVSFEQDWAYSQWQLEGITLVGTGISERTWTDGGNG